MNENVRYFRRTPLFHGNDITVSTVINAKEVEWLAHFMEGIFFQIPANYSLNSDLLYRTGQIIGIDAASVATVWALQLKPGLSCLDTCCAPGMKLTVIKDAIGESGTAVGLDISEHRLDVCYNLMKKFGYPSLLKSIFKVGPGWTVDRNGEFNSESCEVDQFEKFRMRRKSGSRKFRLKKQKIEHSSVSSPLQMRFDRVLVDAQCTHDGSEKHNEKHDREDGFWKRHSKSEKSREHYDTDDKLESLIALQRKLILNGFRMLVPGGLMVYSTCSLQSEQNEEVVQYLLDEVGDEATPGSLPFRLLGDTNSELPLVPAKRVNAYSCLFEPETSGTSGQFIAIIRKK